MGLLSVAIWLPVAVTSGGRLGMCFLVKLADKA